MSELAPARPDTPALGPVLRAALVGVALAGLPACGLAAWLRGGWPGALAALVGVGVVALELASLAWLVARLLSGARALLLILWVGRLAAIGGLLAGAVLWLGLDGIGLVVGLSALLGGLLGMISVASEGRTR